MPDVSDLERRLSDAILGLLAERGAGKTICPSEAARRVQPAAWRPLMDDARRVGARLAGEGRLVITQRGEPVDPAAAKGPIRYRLPTGR